MVYYNPTFTKTSKRTFVILFHSIKQIERRGRMINTPVSYLEVPGSNLGPKTGYPD
jgi:hypothetical protein